MPDCIHHVSSISNACNLRLHPRTHFPGRTIVKNSCKPPFLGIKQLKRSGLLTRVTKCLIMKMPLHCTRLGLIMFWQWKCFYLWKYCLLAWVCQLSKIKLFQVIQLVCYTGWNCTHISTVFTTSPLLRVWYRIYFKLLAHATSLKALHVMSWHLNLQASKASVGFQRNVRVTSRTLPYDHRDFSVSGTQTAELMSAYVH